MNVLTQLEEQGHPRGTPVTALLHFWGGRSQVDRDPLEVKFVARGPVILAISLRTSHLRMLMLH